MITGGTGSFGRAMVKRVLFSDKAPNRVSVFSRDERNQKTMARELQASFPTEGLDCMRFFIGDLWDVYRLRRVLLNALAGPKLLADQYPGSRTAQSMGRAIRDAIWKD